jgi:catechol 2,3-dioxygenase-like lactoylglutathione lyase family enzyme
MPGKRITRRQLGGLIAGFAAANRARAVEQPVALSHFKLRVSDLDRSVGYYYSLFGGLTLEMLGGSHFTPPDMRAVNMKIAPGVTYMILSPPDPKTPAGLEHISLDAVGTEMVTRYHMPWAFPNEPYIRDPEGTWVEFSASAGDWSTVVTATRPRLPGNPAIKPPVFESVAIQRVAIKVLDLTRAAEFYRHFGAEMGSAASKNTRAFDFRGTKLELVASREAPGLDSFTVGVRNFETASASRALHRLGIKASRKQHERIGFHDPDGNPVEVVSV